MRELFQKLHDLLSAGQSAVLVTVTDSRGSAPRGAGARMLVGPEGRVAGTVGGGAMERRCELMAADLLAGDGPGLFHFRLRENDVLDIGAVCGGDMELAFRLFAPGDRAGLALTEALEDCCRTGTPAWLITELTETGTGALALYSPGRDLPADVPDAVPAALGPDPCQVTAAGRRFFCQQVVTGARVYIFGGGHVAQALVPALAAVDFRCVVLEDRPEFCDIGLFPGAAETRLIDNDDPAVYQAITAQDYICVMTRGHRGDTTVLEHALGTPARYIGVIGSRRKLDHGYGVLRQKGFTDGDFARVTGPIGLAIGAQTPAEIAVSVAAQLIAVRAGKM